MLVERKKLSQLKEISIDEIKTKSLENLNDEEMNQYLSFLQYKKDKSRRDEINQKLVEKGITIQ